MSTGGKHEAGKPGGREPTTGAAPAGPVDQLARWLDQSYTVAYRTAFGLLHHRMDAEDAVQDAFLRAWRFRAAVPGDDARAPWLYRVVVNSCLSKLRQDGRYRATVTPSPFPLPDSVRVVQPPGAGPEGAALARDARETVMAALAALPEHLRVVVVLRYYGGLPEAEIARVIRRRPGTVKSRMHEARARLGADAALARLAGQEGDRPVGATEGAARGEVGGEGPGQEGDRPVGATEEVGGR
ncbi:MAG: RNA polymerase sigma factor [Acidimicrobiales bacterium]